MAELVDGFTVQEAADSLGVSRVRVQHLIGKGNIAAERVGNQWLIPRHEIFRAKRIPRVNGRPYTAANCWSIIDELNSGQRPVTWLQDNWYRLGPRAIHRTGRVLPEIIDSMFDDRSVITGGAQAASHEGAPTRSQTPPVDVYVGDGAAERYLRKIGLRSITADANVTVHIVSDLRFESMESVDHVNLVVAYLDLREQGDRAAPDVYHALRHHGHRLED